MKKLKEMSEGNLILNNITIISLKEIKNTYEMEGHQDNFQPLDHNETRVELNFSLASFLFECYEM